MQRVRVPVYRTGCTSAVRVRPTGAAAVHACKEALNLARERVLGLQEKICVPRYCHYFFN